MKNLKIIIVIVTAGVIAAACPYLIWKTTLRPGADPPAEKGYLTRHQLAFVGYATPEATVQSAAWAVVNGDFDKLTGALAPEIRAEIEKDPNARKSFETEAPKQINVFQGGKIMAKKTLAGDKVELKIKVDLNLPKNHRQGLPPFLVLAVVKIGNEWKLGEPQDYTPDWDNGSQPE